MQLARMRRGIRRKLLGFLHQRDKGLVVAPFEFSPSASFADVNGIAINADQVWVYAAYTRTSATFG